MEQKLSRRQFLQGTGIAAGALLMAACTVPAAPAPAPPAGGAAPAAQPAAKEVKILEAWSRMTDVAQQSIKGIIDNYNAKNTKGVKVEFDLRVHRALA